MQKAAHALGLQIHVLNASTEGEINTAFANLAQLRAGALLYQTAETLTHLCHRPRPSTAPISHWTTVRFCNECPGWGARSMSQGLRVLVLVGTGELFRRRPEQLAALAAQQGMPVIYQYREFVAAGGLISYGASLTDAYRLAGVYTGRILKGAKPADLPVMQPTKFELVINLKTAKVLGLTIMPGVLAIADEVIE
jgi:putative tryptophan/tyrosine transport system substrate-binding protein